MDLSPSKLTEKLAGSDSGGKPRGLTIDELEAYLQRTGDLSPEHYLVEKYLNDPEIAQAEAAAKLQATLDSLPARSEEHTSELQSLMRISYAVFCLKKKKQTCTHYH